MIIKAAFGVLLNSKKAVREHLEANKDFVILDVFSSNPGSYINISDMRYNGITQVQIRYGKGDRKVMVENIH